MNFNIIDILKENILLEREVRIVESAYKYRIYPNKNQQELIQKTFGCTRFVYNHFLSLRIEKYKDSKENFSGFQCDKEIGRASCRERV